MLIMLIMYSKLENKYSLDNIIKLDKKCVLC